MPFLYKVDAVIPDLDWTGANNSKYTNEQGFCISGPFASAVFFYNSCVQNKPPVTKKSGCVKLIKMLNFRALLIGFALCTGCASGPYMLPDDYAGDAPGAAYAGDSMMFRKGQPGHQDDKNWDFYYKHCSTNGDESYYSKTSYDCSTPLGR